MVYPPIRTSITDISIDLVRVIFLGIQPASNAVGEIVSPEVLQAVDEVVKGLCVLLRACLSVGAS